MRRLRLICLFLPFLCSSSFATTYYIDGAVSVSGNGQSWATAWKNFSDVTGVQPGDVVYISGGASGLTYTSGEFAAPHGTQANPVTFKVARTEAGCDTGSGGCGTRNGVVTVNNTTGTAFLTSSTGAYWVTWDGNVNGNRNLVIQGQGVSIYLQGVIGPVFRYVTFKGMANLYGADKVEIDHCWFDVPNGNDAAMRGPGGGGGWPSITTGYTANSIHDSLFTTHQSPSGSGFGDDGIQNSANVTINNNSFISTLDTYSGGQHADAIQTDCPYLDIHSNYFENWGNYSVYCEVFGSSAHIRIYDNVSTGFNAYGLPLQHYVAGWSGTAGTISDTIIANNTCYIQNPAGTANCVNLGGGVAGGTLGTDYVVNNLAYRTDIQTHGLGGVTVSNNFSGTANVNFVNVSVYPTGDWHLQSNSSAAINQGISPSYLTSVYTTDKDGNTRAAPWDIGAYEFASGSSQATAASCSPGSGSYGSPQTISCTNPNSGTTVACYTVNGTTPVTNGSGTACTTGTVYTTAITVSATETLKIIAGTSTLTDSSVTTYNYTITAPPVSPSLMLGPITMLGPVKMQ